MLQCQKSVKTRLFVQFKKKHRVKPLIQINLLLKHVDAHTAQTRKLFFNKQRSSYNWHLFVVRNWYGIQHLRLTIVSCANELSSRYGKRRKLEVKKSPKSCSNRPCTRGHVWPSSKRAKNQENRNRSIPREVGNVSSHGCSRGIGVSVSRFWLIFRSGFPFWFSAWVFNDVCDGFAVLRFCGLEPLYKMR